jgi:hypothetical protein
MNYVASSFGAAWTNFVSSQSVSVNTGSSAGRYIVGISTATNGGTAAARNLSSANYGGVGLTLSAVESNNFGSFFQAAHGATTLTGANDFTAVCANTDGGIFVAAAAFDGCAASPLSGLVKAGADNASPTATVSSASGRTVYAIVAELGSQSTLTPGSGVTVIATADASTSRFHLLSIAGASSVAIGGSFPGTRSWSMWAWSLEALAASPVLSSPTVVSTGDTIATVRVTTDTAPSGSSTLAVRTRAAAAPAWTAAEVLASPTATLTSGATGARDFNLTGLTNGTALVADFAQTGPSNVVSTASFTPSTVPSAPTIGTAVAGNGQATVNGTPGSTGGATITGYRSTATPGGSTVSVASLPITHTGLTNGVAYTFTLAAQNSRGFGAESAASNSVTPNPGTDTTPPTQVGSIVIGTVTSTSIQFSWPAGSDNVAVTAYDVSSNGGSSYTTLGNVLTHTFTGLTPSTSYALRVRARDAAGNVSTPPLAATQVTSGAPAPPPPPGFASLSLTGFKQWTGTGWSGISVPFVKVCRASSGAVVLELNSQIVDASGNMAITSASITAGVVYVVFGFNTDGTYSFKKTVTAT